MPQLLTWWHEHGAGLPVGAFIACDGARTECVPFVARESGSVVLSDIAVEAAQAGQLLARQLGPVTWVGVAFRYWEGPKSGVLPLALLATLTLAGTFRWSLLGAAQVIADLSPPIEEVREFYLDPLRASFD